MVKTAFSALRAPSPWFWVIFLAAAVLRLWIAAYNTDANDSHLEVIQRIMNTGTLPVASDCWQCYHAKAFHYPAAVMLARLNIGNPLDQLLILQHVNVLLGLATLLLLWTWLAGRELPEKWKLLLFALIALNPQLAGINTQVTNDTLVIFAATACFFFYARFLDSRRFMHLWIALAACALAIAAKASGLVVAVLVFGHLAALGLLNAGRLARCKKQLAATALVAVVTFAPVPFSGYLQNHEAEGTPLANNIEKYPLPDWSRDNYWSQAGATSIVNSYFTFRWPELVAYPYLIKGPVLFPEHRTSHWTQLFARHNFVHFGRWPASWVSNGWWTTRVGQAAMILGLAPLALLLIGIGSLGGAAAVTLLRSRSLKPLVTDSELFLAAAFALMIAMSLKLSLDFQTYRIMKAIYIYPGLLGALALTARGTAVVLRRVPAAAGGLTGALLVALVAVHMLDLAILGTDLQARYPERVQQLATFEPLETSGPRQIRLDKLQAAVAGEADSVRLNESLSGRALTGGYRKYRYGFGTRARSLVAFRLDGQFTRFRTSMALADEADSTDGVQFEIWGDSRLLYRSPRMIDHQVDSAEVNVSGVKVLALKVNPLGESNGDLANWLHPVLTRKN